MWVPKEYEWPRVQNFHFLELHHDSSVYNFLPSVSAAIGHYRPQRDIWKIAVAAQALIRFLVLIMYRRYYKEHIYKWAQNICNVATITYAIENISLVTLSFWTSDENYAFHKLSFITFLITSFIHMLIAYFIMRNCRNITKESCEATSLKWKRRTMILNLLCIIFACYFFYRHNKYCEPIVYSMFALSEYGVVLSNMGFHSTAAWDFANSRLMVSGMGFRII
ncbi:PREDICTED: post-GPI attachment to proteins factor 2-like isoform X2 [Eufriesea mexicana]|uniref:post-GPI attachment to proteins factor 2-like isoform X2 n=1 Tax=Eufriesea mexicana TaxID=516756 RepID=UPI00083C36A5|nr:PREDICTED: post-GPI attachment to proteins factor 2-like isoform X2 [Eufriesea mexicana]